MSDIRAQEATNKRFSAASGALAPLKAAPAGEAAGVPKLTINAYNGGSMRPDRPYLDAPMVVDLQGASISDPISVLLDHYSDQIVGQSTGTKIDLSNWSIDVNAIVTGDITNPDDPACKVMTHASKGYVWKASMGGEINRMEYIAPGEVVTVNGRPFAGPIYVARACVFDEVSLLSLSADKSTSAKIAAKAGEDNVMDFHDWLKAKGFDPQAINDAQRDLLMGTFKQEQELKLGKDKSGKAPDSEESKLAEIRARTATRKAIIDKANKYAEDHDDRVDDIEMARNLALKEGWSEERFELYVHRDMQLQISNLPRGIQRGPTPSDGVQRKEVFEAALCISGGLSNIEKHYKPEVLEEAHKHFRTGLGMGRFLQIAAKVNGGAEVSHKDLDPLLRAAFSKGRDSRGQIRAGSGGSSIDVSGILSNVANKNIVDHFNRAVDPAFIQIASSRGVNDFKQASSYSLAGDFQYEEVAPGGELKHGKLIEQGYTNQAKTFGKVFTLDRRDLTNDEMNAFASLTKLIGRGGAQALNHIGWTKFLANSTFFTSGHSNLLTGGTSVLSLDSLESLEVKFGTQTDPAGKEITVNPAILLVPTLLKRKAMRLMNSTEVRELAEAVPAAARAYGTGNTFEGDFKVLSSSFLQNVRYSGYSTTAFYLLANPEDMPVIEICYLNNVQKPTVENAQADFDQLGLKFRGYFDFGVELQEYRGGAKSAGA